MATDALTPPVWVKYGDAWAVYQLEALTDAFPNSKGTRWEFPKPDRNFADRLMRTAGKGITMGCPKQTASALSIHKTPEGTKHPDVLWFRATILTPDQRADNGIPRDWPTSYVLDTLDFPKAAALLREYPTPLEGHCSCTSAPV